MVIGRRLIIPIFLVFALLLALSLGFFALISMRQLAQAQEQALRGLQQGLQDEIIRKQEISLALAYQVASDPAVRQVFGMRDYAQLLPLTRPGMLNLRSKYKIGEYQILNSSGEVVLNVVDPQNAGAEHSHEGHGHILPAAQGEEAVGLLLEQDGLCVHGVAPIEAHSPSGAPVYGNVEYGLQLDQAMFSDLRARYGGEWQFLLYGPVAMDTGVQDLTSFQALAGVTAPAELAIQSTTLQQPVFATSEHYRRALAGETPVTTIRASEQEFSVITAPVKDYSGQVVGVVDILLDRSVLMQQLARNLMTTALLGLIGLVLLAFMLNRSIERKLAPVRSIAIAAEAYAKGNLRHPLPVIHQQEAQPDEVEQLSRSFLSMGQQLRQWIGNLELTVAERTRSLEQRNIQMQTAAEIAQLATESAHAESLLQQASALIQQRFGFDHAGIYLLRPGGDELYLTASAGERPRQTESGSAETLRSLAVTPGGVSQTLVSAAVTARQFVFAANIQNDPFYLPDPLMPETRSQAAFPLIIADNVIGVLDLHSRKQNAFGFSSHENRQDTGSQAALQIIAEQLAAAIHRAQLMDTLERTSAELNEARGQQTAENWLAFVRSRPTAAGYRFTHLGGLASGGAAGGLQPIDRRELQTLAEVDPQASDTEVAIPIRLRGQVIGIIRLRFDSVETRAAVEAVAEEVGARLALLLDSARLLEEAQNRAQREQQINRIATQMRSAVDLEGVLQNTVRELGKALGARRTFIQLGDYALTGADTNAGVSENPKKSGLETEA